MMGLFSTLWQVEETDPCGCPIDNITLRKIAKRGFFVFIISANVIAWSLTGLYLVGVRP